VTQPNGPLIAECSTWLSIVSKLFHTRMNALLDPHGLTPAQFSILHHITRQRSGEGQRISEIAAAVEVEQPAVTKTLAKFQNKNLVEITSSTKDKRAKLVTPRPEAGALLGVIYQDIGPDLAQVFQSLDPSDLETFAKLLKQLAKWLDQNRLAND